MVSMMCKQQCHGLKSAATEDSLDRVSCCWLLWFYLCHSQVLLLVFQPTVMVCKRLHHDDRSMNGDYCLDRVSCFCCCIFCVSSDGNGVDTGVIAQLNFTGLFYVGTKWRLNPFEISTKFYLT